MDAYLNIDWV